MVLCRVRKKNFSEVHHLLLIVVFYSRRKERGRSKGYKLRVPFWWNNPTDQAYRWSLTEMFFGKPKNMVRSLDP